MLELICDSKAKRIIKYLVNVFLMTWQLPQVLTGLIGLVIFHNFEIYTNERSGVRVLKVNKGTLFGGACFSSGPIIFVTPGCNEDVIRHETGHSMQSIMFGPLFHLVVSIPSIIRFWIRHLGKKSSDWYLSGWPEKSAEKLGHTDRYEAGNGKRTGA